MDDAQQAYSAFHKLPAESMVHVFLSRKLPNGIIIISGFERINKDKNKLYVKRFKRGNTEDKCEQYRIYRNK